MKTEKQILEQIEKLNRELESIRINNTKTFKIAGLEITKIQDWDKPYNEIEIPKGFRLPTVQEMFNIFDSDYDKWLGKYKKEWNYFYCEQTKLDKLNKRSRWVVLDGFSNLDSRYVDLVNSYDVGRVAFVRVKK